MSDLDIIEGMSNASSSIRYQALVQPATATTSQPVPVRQRASLTVAQPVLERPAQPTTRGSRPRPTEQSRPRRAASSVEPITRANTNGPKPRPTPYQAHQVAQVTHDLDLDDEQNAQATVPLNDTSEDDAPTTTLLDPATDADIQVHMPPVPYRRHVYLNISHQRKHALVFVGLGMAAMLALWLLAVQAMVGWTNTVHDPGYYTQTAHLDVVMVKIDAHNESQVRAFLDPQGHLDLFVFPLGGDMSKAHVVGGPTLSSISDPQKATITVTVKGTVVTVLVQGPLQANFPATTRQSSVWSIDLQKGGH